MGEISTNWRGGRDVNSELFASRLSRGAAEISTKIFIKTEAPREAEVALRGAGAQTGKGADVLIGGSEMFERFSYFVEF